MKKILIYVISLLVVLDCNSVYVKLYNSQNVLDILLIFSLCLLIAYYMLANKNNSDKKQSLMKVILLILGIIMYSLVYIVFTKVVSKRFIKSFMIILPLFLIIYSQSNNLKIIISKIPSIVFILAIISIFFWILGPITNIINPTNHVTIGWGGVRTINSYFNIHFYTQSASFLGSIIPRNTGMFVEGPMYSLVLTLALLIELFINKNHSLIYIIVFLITIFTTVSTTGIVLSVSTIVIYYIFSLKNKNTLIKFLKILSIPLVLLLGFNIVNGFLSRKYNSLSYNVRIDDYQAAIKTFQQYPIFGCGFGDETQLHKNMSSFRSENNGFSNSLFLLLAQGGIYLLLIFVYSMIRIIAFAKKNNNLNLFIFLIFYIVLLSTTLFLYQSIVMNILAISLIIGKKNKVEYNL